MTLDLNNKIISILMAAVSALIAVAAVIYLHSPNNDEAEIKKIATFGTAGQVIIDVMYVKHGFNKCYVLIQSSTYNRENTFSSMVCD